MYISWKNICSDERIVYMNRPAEYLRVVHVHHCGTCIFFEFISDEPKPTVLTYDAKDNKQTILVLPSLLVESIGIKTSTRSPNGINAAVRIASVTYCSSPPVLGYKDAAGGTNIKRSFVHEQRRWDADEKKNLYACDDFLSLSLVLKWFVMNCALLLVVCAR